MASAAGIVAVTTAKNLYTRLYIYAKRAAVLHKYTAITAVFRGTISGKTQPSRTIFGAFGAVSGHREDCKSNNILQNRNVWCLFSRYFRLFRGRFSEPPRWSFFLLAMVIRIVMTIASKKMMVSGRSENCLFRHRCPLGEHTDKLQKATKPSPDAETLKMYIYTLSEKSLQYSPAVFPSARTTLKEGGPHRTCTDTTADGGHP